MLLYTSKTEGFFAEALQCDSLMQALLFDIPHSLGVMEVNKGEQEDTCDFITPNVKLVIKYGLISEYINCFWSVLNKKMRIKVALMSDSTQHFYPFLHYATVSDWLLRQVELDILQTKHSFGQIHLIELVSCLTNKKLVSMTSEPITICKGITEALLHYQTCNERVLKWCETTVGEWNYDLLLTSLILLLRDDVSFGIVVADKNDSLGADMLSLDPLGKSTLAEIPIHALLLSLSIFVTPRVNYLLVKENLDGVMTECSVYVDVPRILRNCHCMYDVYTAGVLANNLRVILIGIMHNCGFDSWSIDECWNALVNENFVEIYIKEKCRLPLPPVSLSRYHLHLLHFIYSTTRVDDLKISLKVAFLVGLQNLIDFNNFETDVGATLTQIFVWDDEFRSLTSNALFPTKTVFALVQKYGFSMKCLPETVVDEIVRKN